MRVLGTFGSRDVADSVKDAFLADGFNAADLIVMSNLQQPEPPEAAKLEVGAEGEGGFAELEEKVGKVVLGILGKSATLDGDGFEGVGKEGALLSISVVDNAEAARARALLERHHAGDIEVA